MDAALKSAFWGIFANKGEICSAGSRLLLHADIHDKFLESMVSRAKRMKVGDPLDKGTAMGSQISGVQMERILGYIRSGIEEGAKLQCGGERDTTGDNCQRLFREADYLLRSKAKHEDRAGGDLRPGALRDPFREPR